MKAVLSMESLIIVRNNGEEQSILPRRAQPPPAAACIVREDEHISFVLRSSEELTEVALWIQDVADEQSMYRRNAGFHEYFWEPADGKTPFFRNYFGMSEITIEAVRKASSERLMLRGEVEIVATKLNADRAEQLLSYLEEKMEDIVRSCFSATHQKAGTDSSGIMNSAALLQKVRQQLETLTQKLPLFQARKRCRLAPMPSVVDINSVHNLSENSVVWVLSHLDMMTPVAVPSPTSVSIHSRHFDIPKIETDILHEDTDVYENRVIAGYLERVASALTDVESRYRTELRILEANDFAVEIPLGYVSISNIRRKFGRKHFSRLLKECEDLQKTCQKCRSFCSRYLPVRRSIKEMPEMTPGFLALTHYRQTFDLITEWHRLGKISLLGERFLYGLRTLSKLYEFFCLFRIIEALEENGLTLLPSDAGVQDQAQGAKLDWEERPIDHYAFSGPSGNRVDLHYELDVRPPALSQSALVDVVHTGAGKDSRYSPDFLLETTTVKGLPAYAVLDAKYTRPNNAMRSVGMDKDYTDELSRITMKYIHGIGQRKGGFTPVRALFVLHPQDFYGTNNNPFRSYHRRDLDIFSDTPIIPALGAIEVTPAVQDGTSPQNSPDWLARVISRTLYLLRSEVA